MRPAFICVNPIGFITNRYRPKNTHTHGSFTHRGRVWCVRSNERFVDRKTRRPTRLPDTARVVYIRDATGQTRIFKRVKYRRLRITTFINFRFYLVIFQKPIYAEFTFRNDRISCF